jgi:hypothetical protein
MPDEKSPNLRSGVHWQSTLWLQVRRKLNQCNFAPQLLEATNYLRTTCTHWCSSRSISVDGLEFAKLLYLPELRKL